MKATTPSFAPLLQRFFTQRLMQQRQASPHTISSYRDTLRFLLKFAQQRLHTPPARLALEVIDAPFIVAFLDKVHELVNSVGNILRSQENVAPSQLTVTTNADCAEDSASVYLFRSGSDKSQVAFQGMRLQQ